MTGGSKGAWVLRCRGAWVLRCMGALVLVFGAATHLSAAEVLLKNSWINKHKNRATTDITFRVDHAKAKPNKIGEKSDDGDLHIAGRSFQVGLPMVVEIVNAGLPALKPVLAAVGTAADLNANVSIAGVWRFWFEHPSAEPQQQGAPVDPPDNTNPDHVFEIHPVSRWADDPLDESFVPVPGFVAHSAATAFARYEKMVITVTKGASFTSFEAKKIPYNYTEFTMILTSAAKAVDDGYMALAKIADLDGKVLVNSARRMVFVGGTRPAQLVATAKKGTKFQALGIPRVNLERLMAKAENGESIDVLAAYEMIIVGITEQN